MALVEGKVEAVAKSRSWTTPGPGHRLVSLSAAMTLALAGLTVGLPPASAAVNCSDVTIWGQDGSGKIVQYNPNGTTAATLVTATGGYALDIALNPAGTEMYAMLYNGDLKVYSVPDGTLLRSIDVTGVVGNSYTSLSFTLDGSLLLGSSNSATIYRVPATALSGTSAAAAPLSTGAIPAGLTGYPGDFVTMPNGDILALGTGDRFWLYSKTGATTWSAPKDVGKVTLPSGAYGMTYSNGSLFLAGADGKWYRVDTIPTSAGTSATVYSTVVISSGASALQGATSIQETNASCSSPAINVTKTAGAVTGPTALGVYTATYAVKVINTSATTAGSYGPITDTPGFDANFAVTGVSWTGTSTGSAATAPYQITTGVTTIAANTTHTYDVTVTFTYDGSGQPAICAATPTSTKGLYNTAGLPADDESQSLTDNAACDNPPPTLEPITGTGPARVFTGYGTPGTVLNVVVDGTTVGTATVAANGSWSYTASSLTDGSHSV